MLQGFAAVNKRLSNGGVLTGRLVILTNLDKAHFFSVCMQRFRAGFFSKV